MPEGTEGREASRLTFSMSGPAFPEVLVTKALGPLLTGTKVSQQQGSGQPQFMISVYFLLCSQDLECPPQQEVMPSLSLGPHPRQPFTSPPSVSSRHIQGRAHEWPWCSAKEPRDKGKQQSMGSMTGSMTQRSMEGSGHPKSSVGDRMRWNLWWHREPRVCSFC